MEHTVLNTAYEGQLRPRSKPEFALSRNDAWLDTGLVALVFGSILFNQVIGPITVICVIASVGAMALLRWERLPQAFTRCWPLLSLPLLCYASALWSEVPSQTVYYSTLYLVTALAGVLIGSTLKRSSYVEGYFLAFATYSIASVLFGRAVIHSSGIAYAGLAGSKNTAGDMAGVAIIVTFAFIALKVYQAKIVQAVCAVALLPIFALLLYLSKATGALLATIMATGLLVAWLVSRPFALQVRGGILAASAVGLVIALATLQFWLTPAFDLVLQATDKGPGLTGRVDIWAIGNRLIAERPWTGIGYNVFWRVDNPDAQIIWEMMGITSQSGFNFHNTQMEIMVDLGYIGLAVAVLMAVYAMVPLIFKSVLEPYYSSICACALLFFFAVKLPFEVVGFSPMHFTTVTMYAIFAMGLRKDKPLAKSRTSRPVRTRSASGSY